MAHSIVRPTSERLRIFISYSRRDAEMADRLVAALRAHGFEVAIDRRDLEFGEKWQAELAEFVRLWDTVVWLATVPVRRFLFTEVGRVGGLAGPDLDGMWAFAGHSAAPVVVAGGIRGVEDLRAIAALGGPIEGAIVGSALYEGVDLAEAIAALA